MSVQSQTWEWTFDQPVAAMWPLMADTARFNEAASLPRHQITEIPRPDGSVHYFAKAKVGPFNVEWQDRPVNWVTGQWLEHTRWFKTGPLKTLGAEIRLEPHGAGSKVLYSVTMEPANLFGRLILGRLFSNTRVKFSRMAHEA